MKRIFKLDSNTYNEFNTLEKLNSPYLIKVIESFTEQGQFCIIMEYCEVIHLDNY